MRIFKSDKLIWGSIVERIKSFGNTLKFKTSGGCDMSGTFEETVDKKPKPGGGKHDHLEDLSGEGQKKEKTWRKLFVEGGRTA